METPKTEDELTAADTATLRKLPDMAAAVRADVVEDDPTVTIPELVLPSSNDTL